MPTRRSLPATGLRWVIRSSWSRVRPAMETLASRSSCGQERAGIRAVGRGQGRLRRQARAVWDSPTPRQPQRRLRLVPMDQDKGQDSVEDLEVEALAAIPVEVETAHPVARPMLEQDGVRALHDPEVGKRCTATVSSSRLRTKKSSHDTMGEAMAVSGARK